MDREEALNIFIERLHKKEEWEQDLESLDRGLIRCIFYCKTPESLTEEDITELAKSYNYLFRLGWEAGYKRGLDAGMED